MLFFRMRWVILIAVLILRVQGFAQIGENSCRLQLEKANLANEMGNYPTALMRFDSCLIYCSTGIAGIDINTGKARALNGLLQFTEAISAAETALQLARNNCPAALIERAFANFSLHKPDEAKADYNHLEALSSKAKDPKKKAIFLWGMARLNWQIKNLPLAFRQIDQAISLDPANPAFDLLTGDIKAAQGLFPEAMANYNTALSKQADPLLVAKKKAITFTGDMQVKYQIHDAKELRIKLGIEEKKQFCNYWKPLVAAALTNEQEKLYFSFICF